jgi:hypothetical protein
VGVLRLLFLDLTPVQSTLRAATRALLRALTEAGGGYGTHFLVWGGEALSEGGGGVLLGWHAGGSRGRVEVLLGAGARMLMFPLC